jgi:undecaprenyl diphosphate synthase
MDGNGRWSEKRGQPRVYGHIRGCRRVKPVIKEADRLGVKALTLFAFSTENWSRPEAELAVLWKLLKKYLIREADELNRRNVRFCAIGELERIPEDVRKVVRETEERLAKNTGLLLTFAVSYGSRRELARAARLFAEDCKAGKRQPSEMCEELLNEYLWTADMGELAEVDMILRTSGERRVSNFLLWQAAYSELVFTDLCWPDFEPRHLREAIDEYCQRDRRFGGVSSSKHRESEIAPSFA